LAAAILTDPAHSAELWIIAADGVPHSLGVLPPGHARTVAIDRQQAARFVPGSKLVVTREQLGGSPDGTP
ncbi:anti-sigma factor, partial [Acinetobacter baumannii]